MVVNRPSRLQVLLVTLIVSGMLVLAPARRANADQDSSGAKGVLLLPVLGPVYLAYLAVVVTFASGLGAFYVAKSIACTPVAAATSSKHSKGFSGSHRDCLWGKDNQGDPAKASEPDKPTELEEKDSYRDDD